MSLTAPRAMIFISLLAGSLLVACDEPDVDLPRLEFNATLPSSLKAGDTTVPLSVVKYSADARGRETKSDPYNSFQFSSSDSAVIRVVQGRRLLGLKAGSATVTAVDNASEARTKGGRAVTVN